MDVIRGQVIREAFPQFAAELRRLLRTRGKKKLAASVKSLRFHSWCGCGDDFCNSCYTAPPPDGAYGPGHRMVTLTPRRGMLAGDVVGKQIVYVEVLDRERPA